MTPATTPLGRPEPGEHNPYFERYISLVPEQDPRPLLETQARDLLDLVATIDEGRGGFRYAEGKWSIREVLCHLADCEIAWAWRLRSIYGASNPSLQPFDQDSWSRAYQGVGYTAGAARATWVAVRHWNLDLIEVLSEEDKHRPAVHAELGPVTLWTMVEIAAGHDLHHLAALEKISAGA